MLISLQECTKLLGIRTLPLNGPQRNFLVRSLSGLVNSKGIDWVKKNKPQIRKDFQTTLKGLGPSTGKPKKQPTVATSSQ